MTSFLCPCVFLQQRFLRNVLPLKRDRGSSLSLARSALSLARPLALSPGCKQSQEHNNNTASPHPLPQTHTH